MPDPLGVRGNPRISILLPQRRTFASSGQKSGGLVKPKLMALILCSTPVTIAQGAWSCPANTACVQYEYDAELRRCIPIYAAAGTPCDDGNACTLNDGCGSRGQCSGTRVTCIQPAN